MRLSHRWIAGLLIVFGLMLSACATLPEEESSGNGPATVEPIEGTDLVRVILTPAAAERLDMQTEAVRDPARGERAGAATTVIPYEAVFYGTSGETWTYVNPEPLTFERTSIAIDHIDGDLVFLSDGPAIGTEVVTRGAAELFGTETGVDE
jgi:hypothetical protein